jgi:hypothetical protein
MVVNLAPRIRFPWGVQAAAIARVIVPAGMLILSRAVPAIVQPSLLRYLVEIFLMHGNIPLAVDNARA